MCPPTRELSLACPACHHRLETLADDRLRCPGDGVEYRRDQGIWRFLTDRDAADLSSLTTDYRRLRRDERWGTDDPDYYRALPFRDSSGRHSHIWRIRAASYTLLERRLLSGGGRRIADLGAGNCWLSWRLARAGHTCAALDLSDDDVDGLAAAGRYTDATEFPRLQASFDRTPLADGSLDLAIFNGSLHYSSDLSRTLAEARRLLRPEGRIVILDSPVYRLARSGERMLRERRAEWRDRYGPDFGGYPTAGFLNLRRLRRLGANVGLLWRVLPLPLGWRWRLSPLVSLCLGRREPARFPLIVGHRIDQPENGGPS